MLDELREAIDRMGQDLTLAIQEFEDFENGDDDAGDRLRNHLYRMKCRSKKARKHVKDIKKIRGSLR